MENTHSSSKSEVKTDIGELFRRLLPRLLYILPGVLSGLCTLPFGAIPFGFAFLSAANKNALFVYVGLVISCFLEADEISSFLLLGIYTAMLLLRVLIRLTLDSPFPKKSRQSLSSLWSAMFSEHPVYRILLSAIGAVSYFLIYTVSGGLLFYDLLGLIISAVAAPLGCALFFCFFEKKGFFYEIGFLSLCAVLMYAAAPIKFYGTSLGLLGGLFTVFYISHRMGFVRGLLCSVVLGLAYSPVLSPILIFAALASGIFMRLSPSLACFVAFFLGLGWGYYIRGIRILDGVFAALLSACLMYSVVCRLYAWQKKSTSEADSRASVSPCRVLSEGELDSIKLFEMNRRMEALGEGLCRLSGFFEELELRFPKYSQLLSICNEAFDSSCAGCGEYRKCRSQGLSEEIQELCALLEKNKSLSSADVSRELSLRCQRLPDILDEINYNSGAHRGRADGTAAFAPDYKALSGLLGKSMEGEAEEYHIHIRLSEALCGPLGELGLKIEGACVYGSRCRRVFIKGADRRALSEGREQIIACIAPLLPFSLDLQGIKIRRSAEGGAMCISESPVLSASVVRRQLRAREEREFCGDSMRFFTNSDNRFFALISDGMGSGRDAAAISEICTEFTESMLSAGGMTEEHLALLNGFLCARCEGNLCECSATVDLMELDTVSGKAAFFKSGAAASYVLRDGSLFKLRCRTMPIGILPETDVKRFDLTLSEGDVIVMMSDGVSNGAEECPWLFDLLRQNIESEGIERTADLVMKYAVAHGSRDDISLAIIKVE